MWLARFEAFAGFCLAAILAVPAWGSTTSANTALPGTLNYVEGQASIGTETLNSKSIGTAELQPGQSLTTEQGKAEILLTPGVFLRVGKNTSVKMISPSLTNTEVELERGHIIVEVAEIYPENDLRVFEDGKTARLLKTGLYDFDGRQQEMRVFDGKAVVQEGDKQVTVKGGHELNLSDQGRVKPQKFDKKFYQEGDLYRWSSLRSGYLAEANVDAASVYASGYAGNPGWWGAGWYWDPWFDAFTFIPADGIFYSPFGWGFCSPIWVYQAPLFGYGYGYRHYYHHFSTDYHNWGPGSHYVAGRTYASGVYRGPGSFGGGFHSGPRMLGSARGSTGFRGAAGLHGGSAGAFHGGGGFHGGFSGGGHGH